MPVLNENSSKRRGVSAENWEKLGEIIPVPGYSDEKIHLFLATGLSPARQNLDPDEILHVHVVDFNEAVDMVPIRQHH